VGLNSDPDQVKQVIQEAIRDSEHTVPRDEEEYSPIYFLAYMDNGLQMATTVYYTPDSPTEVVKDDVNSRVKRALDANNIEIPYNYITVTTPLETPAGKA
jgi:small conductance mechanosensitive channel